MDSDQITDDLLLKYNLIDKLDSRIYDKFTEEVAKEFSAYGVIFSLITDKHVWFLSKIGVEKDGIDIHLSLSAKMIANNLPHIVIKQFSKDDQYKDHYFHVIMGMEFFAAVPVNFKNGTNIGALSVFDFEPYDPSADRLDFLKRKASEIADLIWKSGLHRKKSKLRSPKDLNVLTNGPVGKDFCGIHINMETNELEWDPANNLLFKLKMDWVPKFNDLINPDFSRHFRANSDVLRIMKDLQNLINNPGLTRHCHLYTIQFALHKPLYVRLIYFRASNHIHVHFKNESEFLELERLDFKNKSFLSELEFISQIGRWEFDITNNSFRFSKNAAKILNLGAQSFASFDSLAIEDRVMNHQTLINGFKNSITSNSTFSADFQYQFSNEVFKILRVTGKSVVNDKLDSRIEGTLQDITSEEAKSQFAATLFPEEVKEREFYRSLVNNNSVFILLFDHKGRLKFSNNYHNQVLEKNGNESIGLGYSSILSKEKVELIIENCLKTPGSSVPYIYERIDQYGNRFPTQWDCCTIDSDASFTPDVLMIGIDIITSVNRFQESPTLIEQIFEQKKRFLEFGNIINHNVRSQVANLQGLVQLINLMKSPKEKVEYFQYLDTTAKNLSEIIKVVSSVLSIQNNFDLEKSSFLLEKLIDDILSDYWKEMIEIPIQVSMDIPAEFRVLTNKNYLSLVLDELIKNAIQFRNPNKRLELAIKAYFKSNFTIVEISDNGIGIDMGMYKDRLFKLYDTLSRSAFFKGTGLYLSKVRMTALGGKIRLNSDGLNGTTVYIELPNE